MLSFKIFGEDTREKDRKIAFESEIVEEKHPEGEVVTVDTTKPSGYREITQSAHTGYNAKLWKIIYIKGVEKERVLVNTSSYQCRTTACDSWKAAGSQKGIKTQNDKKQSEQKKTETKKILKKRGRLRRRNIKSDGNRKSTRECFKESGI